MGSMKIPHIFLSSKDGKLKCLTVELPRKHLYLIDDDGIERYQATLQSAMDSAVEVENFLQVAAWQIPSIDMPIKQDTIYKLEGYQVELQQKPCEFDDCWITEKCHKGLRECHAYKVALITPLQKREEETQEQMWSEVWKEVRLALDQPTHKEINVALERIESKFTIARRTDKQ